MEGTQDAFIMSDKDKTPPKEDMKHKLLNQGALTQTPTKPRSSGDQRRWAAKLGRDMMMKSKKTQEKDLQLDDVLETGGYKSEQSNIPQSPSYESDDGEQSQIFLARTQAPSSLDDRYNPIRAKQRKQTGPRKKR